MIATAKHISFFFVALFLIGALCVPSGATAASDYLTFQADNHRSGAVDAIFETSLDSKEDISQYFQSSQSSVLYGAISGYEIKGSLAIEGTTVYFGSTGTNSGLYSVDVAEKNPVATEVVQLSEGIVSGVTLDSGKLYAGGSDGKLYAVTVSEQTSVSTDILDTNGLYSTPLVVGDTVYITSQTDPALFAFNASTLTEEFNISLVNFDGPDRVAAFSSPTLGDNGILYTAGGAGLVAIDPAQQKIIGTYPADGPVGTPSFNNGTVYFTTNSTFYSVDASLPSSLKNTWDPKEKAWVSASTTSTNTFDTSASAATPAVKNGIIIVNEVSRYAAYDELTGNQLWEYTGDDIKDFNAFSSNSPVIFQYNGKDAALFTAYSGYTSAANLQQNPSHVPYIYGNLVACYLNGTPAFTASTANNFYVTTSSPAVVTSTESTYGAFVVGTAHLQYSYTRKIMPMLPKIQTFSADIPPSLQIIGYKKTPSLGKDTVALRHTYTEGGNLITVEVPLQEHFSITVNDEPVVEASPLGALHLMLDSRNFYRNEVSIAEFIADATEGLTQITKGDVSYSNDGTNKWYVSVGSEDPVLADWQTITRSFSGNGIVLTFSYGQASTITDNPVMTYTITVFDQTEGGTGSIFPINDGLTFVEAVPQERTFTVSAQDTTGTSIDPHARWSATGDVQLSDETSSSVQYTIDPAVGNSGTITLTCQPGDESTLWEETYDVSVEALKLTDNSEPETYLTWRGDNTHAGVLNQTGPKTNTTRGTILYSQEPLKDSNGNVVSKYASLVDGSPVLNGDKVYFSIWDGGMPPIPVITGLYCHNITTGEEVWNSTKLVSRSPVTISNGNIYGGTIGGTLVCLDAADGTRKWGTEPISSYAYVGLTAAPVVVDDIVYVITSSGNSRKTSNTLYGFDVDTGTEVYNISANGPNGISGGINMYASVSTDPEGKILYVPGRGGVFAVYEDSRAVIWGQDFGAYGPESSDKQTYIGTPVYKDQKIYVLTTGNLYVLDAKSGEILTHVSDARIVPTAPVVTDDRILITGAGLLAYDLNGEFLWQTKDTSASGRAAPIVADGVAYYGTSSAGTVFAVNVSDGTELWRYVIPRIVEEGWDSYVEATPLISNGELYVGSEDGMFRIFGEGSDKFTKSYQSVTDLDFEIVTPISLTAGVSSLFSTNNGYQGYVWDFGDSTSTSGNPVVKIWKNPGNYTVKASAGDNIKTLAVTVKPAPAALTDPKEAGITIPDTVPDDRTPVLIFDKGDSSADTIAVTISTYDTTAPAAYTPPNSAATVLYMTVDSVDGITDKTSLKSYAKLTVNLSVGADTRSKISFWRYADGLAADVLPELLTSSVNLSGDDWTTYDILVPGFSAIVGSVNEADIPVINPPSETGGGSGSSSGGSDSPGITYTDINPGTGTFTYVTNHPDWPATTFTISKMTAFGVLHAAVPDIVTAERWGGVYVHSINGLAPASETEGWMYQVNGISPGAMANNYQVKAGDKVVWYYSENMDKPVSQSKKVYAYTVTTGSSSSGGSGSSSGDSALEIVTAGISPASSSVIPLTLPSGASVSKTTDGQTIRIDTNEAAGRISVTGRSVTVTAPGILITIPVTGVEWNGNIATATIRGMTAEIMPAAVKIPIAGTRI